MAHRHYRSGIQGGKLKYIENGEEKTQTEIKEKKRPWRKAKRRIKETEIEKVKVSITESEKTEKTSRDWRKDRRQSVSPNILKMKKMFEKVAEKTGENEERNGQNNVKQEIIRLNEKYNNGTGL